MRIAIGCDHAGFEYKEMIAKQLIELNHEVVDFGCFSTQAVDYPQIAHNVAKQVALKKCERGIVVCGTGIGVSIVANKVENVRCALVYNEFMARSSREHNDSNVLALGQRVIGTGVAKEIVNIWLNTPFAGERHQIRVEQINELQKGDRNEG